MIGRRVYTTVAEDRMLAHLNRVALLRSADVRTVLDLNALANLTRKGLAYGRRGWYWVSAAGRAQAPEAA